MSEVQPVPFTAEVKNQPEIDVSDERQNLQALNQLLSKIAQRRNLSDVIQLRDTDQDDPNTAQTLRYFRSLLTYELHFANPEQTLEIAHLRTQLDKLANNVFQIDLVRMAVTE